MNKKILIISPINQWGGVNVDVGFIAQAFKENNNEIMILSLSDYYDDCSIFEFVEHNEFNSIDRILLRENLRIKIILFFLNLIKPIKKPLHHRVNNFLTKKLFNLKKIKLNKIFDLINKYDIVFMCHHFTGDFVVEIAEYCSYKNIPFYIRVTQQINERNFNYDFLNIYKKIDRVIIHSSKNIPFLEKNNFTNFSIIDQCVYNENLYQPKFFKNKIKSFYTLGRIEKTKNIEQMINAFISMSDQNITLDIYGDGIEKSRLTEVCKNYPNIIFHNSITLDKVYEIHNQHECLLISSYIEGGPYTALEAMCAGNLIISTKVGAMEDRLGENFTYFYNGTDEELRKKINDLKNLEINDLNSISKHLTVKYFDRYSINQIYNQYQEVLH